MDDSDRIHKVYSKLLSVLSLSEEHREVLHERQLSDEEIKQLGYKTFPIKRADIVSVIAQEFAEDGLFGVPGFWRDDKGIWQLAGRAGIAIPIRNEKGKIISIKIRVDNPKTPASKYLLLSSNPKVDNKTGICSHPDGTAAKIAVHFPLGIPKVVKKLRITEGEIKADVITSMLPEYTISLPGVSNWRLGVDVAELLKPELVVLCFDSDKDEPRNASKSDDASYGGSKAIKLNHFQSDQPTDVEEFFVGKCLASLYLALKRAGYAVVIEEWPKELGKGIDDVVLSGAGDKVFTISNDEADAFAEKMLMLGIPTGWIYSVATKRFIHVTEGHELDKEQFSDKFRPENPDINAAMVCLQNPAFVRVDRQIYMPERPIFYKEDGVSFYNFWRQGNIHRIKGNVDTFLSHAEYIIPDERERTTFLDWLAFNVQFPGKKIHWSTVVQGGQGTGKSYFGRLMTKILGKGNVSMPTNEMIHEPYTAWQKSCSLVVVEEVMAAQRRDLMNKLKPIITEPFVQIREMYMAPYQQPNVFNLLMFTNHKDAIVLEDGDRRYFVIFSPAIPKSFDYYNELWSWTDANLPALNDFMLSRDLSKFQAMGHAPFTQAKAEIINDSKPALTAWIKEMIDAEAWPFNGDLTCTAHLISVLPPFLKHTSLQNVGRALAAAGAVQLGQVRVSAGIMRLWAVRRTDLWKKQSTASISAEYDKWLMNSQPGGDKEFNPFQVTKPI